MCESVLHDEEAPVFIKYDLVNAGLDLPQGGGGDVVDHLNEGQRIRGGSTAAAHTLNQTGGEHGVCVCVSVCLLWTGSLQGRAGGLGCL